ncbi:kinase-like domain-containing protein [Thelonectria olida]|uniref:EKC/KEOPS complex subunit BUD32 n=1 Tax=Thelonectria olida TaxID=1576542 RepID=A0A9P8W4A2_9HYPO|nr:kinase-like domain-containing protein [Thelonectria olida]
MTSNSEAEMPHLDQDNYEISRQIGKGKYALVFEAMDVLHRRQCALKVFKPEKKQKRIEREVQILKHLAGGPNIISLFDVVEEVEGIKKGLALELVDHTDFRTLFPRFGDDDIRYYMRELLKALQFCHGQGVMHRDVRPHNVVIDHQAKKLRLIGWGSAAFYTPGTEYSVRISLWKAPELLLDYQAYDCSLDMWAFGAMFASMIFRKEPFFHGTSRSDQLVKISRVLGTEKLFEYVEKYGIELDREDAQALEHVPRREWTSFVREENVRTANAEAVDFLDRVVRFDHQDRLTADEALNHPYFCVREVVEGSEEMINE